MFKFDFYSSPAAETDETQHRLPPADAQHLAQRVQPDHDVDARLATGVETRVTWRSRDVTLVRAVPSGDACPAAPADSDLVPGVYEGGLKVWEASIDLVEYLAAELSVICGIDEEARGGNSSTGAGGDTTVVVGAAAAAAGARCGYHRQKRVLELGCGHGFPGIMALRQGMHVCFSDFNREVIEQVTVPNVRLNVQQEYWNMAEYYCGDWGSLSPLLDERDGGGQFDLILTAETLYTIAVAEKVLQMILHHLSSRGQALVASKRFYFGTGGSTQHFRTLAAADRRLLCSDVSVVDTGKGNIREVLKVSWREGHQP